MSTIVIFYEKPGCRGNARQKKMLMEAGITPVVRDMLSEPWDEAGLMAFFKEEPVTEWFNPFAPQVKSGEIDPAALTPSEALKLMIEKPILIKRPLMQFRDVTFVGFEPERLKLYFPDLDTKKGNPGTCTSSDGCDTKE